VDSTSILLAVAVLLLGVVPLARVNAGGVPVYLSDVGLAALAVMCFRPSRLGPKQHAILGWGAAFLFATVPSLFIGLATSDQPIFTVYYYARRVLALTTFGTFLVLLSTNPGARRIVLVTAAIALCGTSLWSIAQVVTRSTGIVGQIDHFYSDVLAQAVLQPSVSRWEAAWKTPRAVAGWWNSNTTGAALALGLGLLPALAAGPMILGLAGAAWVALLATGSRQALVAGGIVMAATILGRRSGSSRTRRWLTAAVAVGGAAALLLASDQLARIFGTSEGGLDVSFESRWNNYPPFWDALWESSPLVFLFGHGAEQWTVVTRVGTPLDPESFVSNALLLISSENGAVPFVFALVLLTLLVRYAETAWQRGIVVTLIWLVNCDNHLYLSPQLIAFAGIALAVSAAPIAAEAPTWVPG
jgi:hypothetical protein